MSILYAQGIELKMEMPNKQSDKQSYPIQEWIIESAQAGLRLDKVLATFLPEMSLRTRRRLCESGAVWLNAKPASAAVKVCARQTLSVHSAEQTNTDSLVSQGISPNHSPFTAQCIALEIAYQDRDFAVISKPSGLHTVALAGSTVPSLEQVIRHTFMGKTQNIELLTRLDKETCGFVVVAFSAEAISQWSIAEKRGKIEKTYLALVEGIWPEPYTVRRALDTANRRVTRIRHHDTPDERRHTKMRPIQVFEAGVCPYLSPEYPHTSTLVHCVIQQGARHQIRAHLTAAGHPLVYDILYGSIINPAPLTTFLLQNTHITSPFFEVTTGQGNALRV